MELTWCRSFVAVIDFGGFSAAAHAIHRTQSRISAHVASLEAAMGAKLLDRRTQPPTLTAAGRTFLPNARAAVAAFDAGAYAVSALDGVARGTLTLGSFPAASVRILAPALRRFRDQVGALDVDIREGASRWTEEALRANLVELAVRAVLPRPLRDDLDHLVLTADPLVVILPSEHPLAHGPVSVDDLRGRAVVTTGEAERERRIGAEFAEFLASAGADLARCMTVSHPLTLAALVRAELGIGLLGTLAASTIDDADLITLPLLGAKPEREVGIFWRRSRTLSWSATAFRDIVRTTASLQR